VPRERWEREREVRQQYEQDYCPGLLPRTIAQYYCLSNTKYLHRNYCFKSYLRTIVRIFFSSTTTSFFFSGTWCNSPIPKKMRGEGWKLDDQASIVLVRLNACLTRNIWERSEFSVRCECTVHPRTLSLQRDSNHSTREREREKERWTVECDSANSTLSHLCTTVSGEKGWAIERRLMTTNSALSPRCTVSAPTRHSLSRERETAAPSLSLCRNRVVSTRERRERERASDGWTLSLQRDGNHSTRERERERAIDGWVWQRKLYSLSLLYYSEWRVRAFAAVVSR